MVFASLVFLTLFLPANLICYYSLRRESHRHLLQVVFSLFFYAWGEPIWVSLLVLTSIWDYSAARLVERWLGTWKSKAALAASMSMNVGLLAVFKYSAFVVHNVNDVLGTHIGAPAFTLPIGISFYTFASMSYVIDVYRREVVAQRSYIKFLMFVSLFHQLVAGPIVRYAHIAKEIEHGVHRLDDFTRGIHRLCVGLFKKVMIANVAGELVKQYFEQTGGLASLSVAESWFAIVMYTLQIYFDFSGYSDMAIGLGLMFGFHYHENFQYPYAARSVSDFWRRWHISLSSWFRDYVYIPLGGKERRPYRNLFIVWGLTGLWHGASWNFVLWGLYYGTLIALERLFLRRVLERLPRIFQHVYLLAIVVVGWALFYFTDFQHLRTFFAVAFGTTHATLVGPDLADVLRRHAFWLVVALVACMPIVPYLAKRVGLDDKRHPWLLAAQAVADVVIVVVAVAMLCGKSYNPFLYFRF